MKRYNVFKVTKDNIEAFLNQYPICREVLNGDVIDKARQGDDIALMMFNEFVRRRIPEVPHIIVEEIPDNE